MSPSLGSRVHAVALCAGVGMAMVARAQKSMGDLSGPWQLFIDNYCVAEKSGVVRTYHPFKKDDRNPVGGSGLGGRGTILPGEDGKGYRKWVTNSQMATSPDGMTWTLRSLVRDYQGQRGNPVVVHTPWDEGREYKMIGWERAGASDPLRNVHPPYGRYGAYSNDGIHWFNRGAEPLLWSHLSDTGLFGWDPHTHRYFGTPKLYTYVRGFSRRCVGFSASAEFAPGWPSTELILLPDEFDDRWVTKPGQRTEFYNLGAFAYESMYLGFIEVFRNTDGWKEGTIFIELVSSRDGLRWSRPEGDRAPILPLGEPGTWDAGIIQVPNHPLIEADTIKLFYYGNKYTHGFGRSEYPTSGEKRDAMSGRLGLATLRKDGFVSLDAAANGGTIVTQLLRGASGALAVNYNATRGWLKAEIQDEAGEPIPGYTLEESTALAGDSVNATVSWRSRRELPAGRPIRIRFVLQNASIYSFAAGAQLRIDAKEPELAILHTFEGDRGRAATDYLKEDGSQGLHFLNAVLVDDDTTLAGRQMRAAFGSSQAIFLKDGQHARMLRAAEVYEGRIGYPWVAVTWNVLEIESSFRPGTKFTLAAMIDVEPGHKARLFSSWDPFRNRVNEPPYERDGWIGKKELVFDFDASGQSPFGCLRVYIHGAGVSAPGSFSGEGYNHVAITYDDGAVILYLDGKEIGRGKVPGGAVALLSNLHVGGNPGAFYAFSADVVPSEQFEGLVDDILVIGRVLTPDEVRIASDRGAQFLFDTRRDDVPTIPPAHSVRRDRVSSPARQTRGEEKI